VEREQRVRRRALHRAFAGELHRAAAYEAAAVGPQRTASIDRLTCL
jgi:hypothetical protein